MPKLSKRLAVIASFVPKGALACDIGTDHGYLAIELAKSGHVKSVIATDIAKKPLETARKNICKAGCQNISLRLCNGLEAVSPSETDTVIIAGMGGEVISGILEKGSDVAKRKNVTLILQPTTSPEHLRRFLCKNGYVILREEALYENGKVYSVMQVEYTGKEISQKESFYYIGSLEPNSEAAILYIQKQLGRAKKCMQALEGVVHKSSEYLHYKTVFEEITENLEQIGE